MVHIDVVYEGNLHCSATHGPSASRLATDAPVDNNGRGETFSPTDLLATSLGACMATVMGIVARKNEWSIDGARISIEKHMATSGPRRVARLPVHIEMPAISARLDDSARRELEHTAQTCPVRLSIHEAIDVPVEFAWPKAVPA
jgi:putative redox protein